MSEHPENVIVPRSHLMSLPELAEHLGVDPHEYLLWVIRGEAPPLNVTVNGESHILREDLIFWLDSLSGIADGEEPDDVLALKLSLDEVADIFGVGVDDYLDWVEAGDAPPVSTFRDGDIGVVRASLDAWASDAPDPESILAALRDAEDEILEALRQVGFEDPEQALREILGEEP
jgi:hypothetical protein